MNQTVHYVRLKVQRQSVFSLGTLQEEAFPRTPSNFVGFCEYFVETVLDTFACILHVIVDGLSSFPNLNRLDVAPFSFISTGLLANFNKLEKIEKHCHDSIISKKNFDSMLVAVAVAL